LAKLTVEEPAGVGQAAKEPEPPPVGGLHAIIVAAGRGAGGWGLGTGTRPSGLSLRVEDKRPVARVPSPQSPAPSRPPPTGFDSLGAPASRDPVIDSVEMELRGRTRGNHGDHRQRLRRAGEPDRANARGTALPSRRAATARDRAR